MRLRIISYGILFFSLILLPRIPLPFQKSTVLHSLFYSRYFHAASWAIVALSILISIVLIFFVFAKRFRKDVWNVKLLSEALALLAFPIVSILLSIAIQDAFPPFDTFVSLNRGREPSAFVNPYLGYKKFDCTTAGPTYDYVFFPGHITPGGHQFISFAPRRLDKSASWRDGQKDGDWFLDHFDSAWNEELFKCVVLADH